MPFWWPTPCVSRSGVPILIVARKPGQLRGPTLVEPGFAQERAAGDILSGAEGAMLVGIDVAKAELVIATRPAGETWAVANDEAGVRALATRLGDAAPELVVLEATGGYEWAAVAALAAAGLPVVVVNPRQVREFARHGRAGEDGPDRRRRAGAVRRARAPRGARGQRRGAARARRAPHAPPAAARDALRRAEPA